MKHYAVKMYVVMTLGLVGGDQSASCSGCFIPGEGAPVPIG
jgi:hypothetical protein